MLHVQRDEQRTRKASEVDNLMAAALIGSIMIKGLVGRSWGWLFQAREFYGGGMKLITKDAS